MYLLYNDSTDPAFNLALEEYMLTKQSLDIIMLWRNAPSVIIGRNQNAIEEMDLEYIRENDIKVIRRQSGGGAVFHDLGNINFTVIHTLGEGDFNNYAKFTAPVVEFLNTIGVEAYLHGRNDLLIGGMKFSGNAQAVRGGRIMHHGTIMYDADVSALAKSLRPNPVKIQSKGISSVRSRVTNIASHLGSPMPVEAFLDKLYAFYLTRPEMAEHRLNTDDIAAVNTLVTEKYGTWEWNIGASPQYNYQKTVYFPFGGVGIGIRAVNSVIGEIRITGDFFGVEDVAGLESLLRGVPHDRAAIAKALAGVELERYISGVTMPVFLELF